MAAWSLSSGSRTGTRGGASPLHPPAVAAGTAPTAVAGKRSPGNWAAGGASRKQLRWAGPSRGARAGAPRVPGAQRWHPRPGPDRPQAGGEVSAVADLPPGRRAAGAHQRALQTAPDPPATAKEPGPSQHLTLLAPHPNPHPQPCHGEQTTPTHPPPRSLGFTLLYTPLYPACANAMVGGILSLRDVFIRAEVRVHLPY